MRGWMLPWLFPLGVLITIALVALFPQLPASLVAVGWGWILFPTAMILIRARGSESHHQTDQSDLPYWRTKPTS